MAAQFGPDAVTDATILVAGWQSLRLLRSDAPGLARGDRLRVFVAALEQSEQLMRAAANVGPAARPLPLFYSLSQAGRAIVAARLPGNRWRLAMHGLTEPVGQGVKDILRRVIRPQDETKSNLNAGRRTSFSGVADAIGSDGLTGSIELGAIWAAMPHLMEPNPQMPGLDPDWRRPLIVYPSPMEARDPESAPQMIGRPLELLVRGGPQPPGKLSPVDLDSLLNEIETHYPTSSGIAVPFWQRANEITFLWSPSGELLPVFSWPNVTHPVRVAQLDAIAPMFRDDVRMLPPRVGGRDFLALLMLWWVLLFGLSMIARYDPEVWLATLDVNRSKQAVPVEAALDEALVVLPQLIFDAIVSQ